MTDREKILFIEQQQIIFKRTDRMFVALMTFQWLAGIAAALWISPKTWIGQYSQTHLHVWIAIFLGGTIAALPILLGIFKPGHLVTRYVIAVSQMLMSALLIHLSGGRIETHFHVFGSLAFLAFYRDWRVLIPATVVVAADHWLRGVYWPLSVFGVLSASPWRWVEHAAWVVFEDIFLVLSCLQGVSEMQKIAERTAKLEMTNKIIEEEVTQRTKELSKTNLDLKKEIEDRKRLENIVLQSEKMSAVGQLAAGVAHEINNPLGVILGFSQGVSRRIQPGDPLEMPLKSIEREAMRCKELVHNLLLFSRAGKTEKEEIDINETIESSLSLVMAQAKVKSAQLIKELDLDLPKLFANKSQIQQVIINLSNNAMDAMPDGGKLILRTKKSHFKGNEAIEIQVEDTGQGISKEIQSKIFEPFFTTKEVGKGTGLGLSLVFEIVQKHRGHIELISAIGKGTLFKVYLPIKE